MNPSEFGINGGWWGLRTTKNLVEKFDVNTDDLNPGLGPQSDWGLVGSATPNGWDGPDFEMHETGANTYAVYVHLVSGEIKFRFNEDWGNNYGDDNTDGTLEPGGANIPIAEEATYFITLDLNNFTYSISKYTGDSRNMFFTDGQSLEIDDPFDFSHGYAIAKYKNVDINGNPGSDASGNFVYIDFPMFRLADA
jgi:hypothetical protein